MKTFTSSSEAELELISLEHTLQRQVRETGIVETELSALRRKILDLEMQKKPLELQRVELSEFVRKGRENIRITESELRNIKTEFWRLKHENL